MRTRGIRSSVLAVLAAVGVALCLTASAQQELVLFKGDRPADAGLILSGWGSGDIRETGEAVYIGSTSLQVVTQGFYQGGRIAFQQPVSLRNFAMDPNAYLVFQVRLPGGTGNWYTTGYGRGYGMPGVPGMPSIGAPDIGGLAGPRGAGRVGGAITGAGRAGGRAGGVAGPPSGPIMGGPAPGMGGMPGAPTTGTGRRTGGMLGGFPGMPGYGPYQGGYTAPTMTTRVMRQMRVVVVTADGKQYEAVAPFDPPLTDQEGWFPIGVALGAFKGLSPDAQIREIRVFGDAYGVFYVGEIRVATDATPITGDAGEEQIVAANDLVRLEARASAGITPLRYSWDFDASDGIQEDAVGRVVTTRYRKPGEYTVTLTVTDIYGMKKPFVATTKVTVNE
ncbi:MAG: PKD domain-containing protein [Armatimonadetes bacterium]|nr:PKD domain-containing protein [Armatimonadota bacterium]